MDDILIHRSLTVAILEALKDTEVVSLPGPRQCGKNTLALQLNSDRMMIILDEARHLDTAKSVPAGFIDSLPHRVTLDKIQRAPEATSELAT